MMPRMLPHLPLRRPESHARPRLAEQELFARVSRRWVVAPLIGGG
jgi:hypothetical protein